MASGMRWVWKTLVGMVLFSVSVPGYASTVGEKFPIYTGEELKALYDYAVAEDLPNLDLPRGRLPVTGDAELDDRIWEIAEERGYILRPLAGEGVGTADGVVMQPQAAAAWSELKAEARAAGLGFIVSSAYRSRRARGPSSCPSSAGRRTRRSTPLSPGTRSRGRRSITVAMRWTFATGTGPLVRSVTHPTMHGSRPTTSTMPSDSGSYRPIPTTWPSKAPTPSRGSSSGSAWT